MSLAELLSGRYGLAGRLPHRLEELRGPVQGVIVLPRHLSWPGMREFDVTDDQVRRSLYGIMLTRGRRADMARFVNARLLRQDWPLLRTSLDPKVRRCCERRLALRHQAEYNVGGGEIQVVDGNRQSKDAHLHFAVLRGLE